MAKSSASRSKLSAARRESAGSARFRDPLLTLWDFSADVLVRCPACAGRAHAQRLTLPTRPGARLVCPGCGHTDQRDDGSGGIGGAFDPWFGQPLWLQTSCLGETLWAFDLAHVELLEAYVAARLRERHRSSEPASIRNRSLLSRLPDWMKLARHRPAVLRGLAELRRLAANER